MLPTGFPGGSKSTKSGVLRQDPRRRPVDAFEMSGTIAAYEGRGFCPRCGSRLLDPADPGDSLIEIRLGTLDNAPFDLTPEAEVWVKRRETWIPPVEGAAQYDENRG
jgi:hypothetical protein